MIMKQYVVLDAADKHTKIAGKFYNPGDIVRLSDQVARWEVSRGLIRPVGDARGSADHGRSAASSAADAVSTPSSSPAPAPSPSSDTADNAPRRPRRPR